MDQRRVPMLPRHVTFDDPIVAAIERHLRIEALCAVDKTRVPHRTFHVRTNEYGERFYRETLHDASGEVTGFRELYPVGEDFAKNHQRLSTAIRGNARKEVTIGVVEVSEDDVPPPPPLERQVAELPHDD